jgi:uncharacterized repeat protein (TIGR03803 family)
VLYHFSGAETGANPYGSLALSGNVLYGMTHKGGGSNMGCIFKINTNGTGYTQLLDFLGQSNGSYPYGSLTISGDVAYGMTWSGGAYDLGCIFQFNTLDNEFLKLWDFSNNQEGKYPFNDITASGNVLYGMTGYGGANLSVGVIFKYSFMPDIQTSNISFPFVGISIVNIAWTAGNGVKRAVFMKEGTGTITDPDDNTTYTASTDWNVKGSQLGSSGYYCVYNDTGNFVSVMNLTPGTTYTVQAFEYNGDAGNELYLFDTETGNPNTFQTESVNSIQDNRESFVRIYSDGIDIYAIISHCDDKARLAVYNLTGICLRQSDNLVEGQNKITGDYLPGIYVVKLLLDNRVYTEKVKILK